MKTLKNAVKTVVAAVVLGSTNKTHAKREPMPGPVYSDKQIISAKLAWATIEYRNNNAKLALEYLAAADIEAKAFNLKYAKTYPQFCYKQAPSITYNAKRARKEEHAKRIAQVLATTKPASKSAAKPAARKRVA